MPKETVFMTFLTQFHTVLRYIWWTMSPFYLQNSVLRILFSYLRRAFFLKKSVMENMYISEIVSLTQILSILTF